MIGVKPGALTLTTFGPSGSDQKSLVRLDGKGIALLGPIKFEMRTTASGFVVTVFQTIETRIPPTGRT